MNISKNQRRIKAIGKLKIFFSDSRFKARVILSSLDSLHKNPIWNSSNFKIASVHLMGAAVDNEEVSTNPEDIINDKTNWGSPKSDYGEAIQEEIVDFYNLFNPEDNIFDQKKQYRCLQIIIK